MLAVQQQCMTSACVLVCLKLDSYAEAAAWLMCVPGQLITSFVKRYCMLLPCANQGCSLGMKGIWAFRSMVSVSCKDVCDGKHNKFSSQTSPVISFGVSKVKVAQVQASLVEVSLVEVSLVEVCGRLQGSLLSTAIMTDALT